MNFLANTFLLIFLVSRADVTSSNDVIQIDTQSDLAGLRNWYLAPSCGYSKLPSGFNCPYGGGVDLPEGDLHGQVGFWTACESSAACQISYSVQPGDTSFAARVYNKYIVYVVVDDGQPEQFGSHGWIDIKKEFRTGDKIISIWLYHNDPSSFNVLDKFAINGELPPLIPEDPKTTTDYPTTSTELWTTTLPIEWDYCPAYPNATEHTALFPHTDSVVSTSCGEVFDSMSGGISYKPYEPVQANERCVWIIAVPGATGYDVTILYYGHKPEDDHGLIISEFGAWRAPTHIMPTSTDKLEITDTSILLVTFFTGSQTISNQAGFILQFNARTEGDISHPVSPLSRHFLIGPQQYFLPLDEFHPNELSSVVFLPEDNIYRGDKVNKAYYLHGSGQDCEFDQLKIYLFNTTCVGPHKWQYQGRLCGRTPTYEVIRSSEPILIIFETTRGTDEVTTFTGPQFIYSASD